MEYKPARQGGHSVIGAALVVLGIALTHATGWVSVVVRTSAVPGFPAELDSYTGAGLLVGALLTQAGAISTVPWFLGRLADTLGRVDVGARIASRDAARNRSRSLPVIAAIMGTTFLAVFLMCSFTTSQVTSRVLYPYLAMPGSVQVNRPGFSGGRVLPEPGGSGS